MSENASNAARCPQCGAPVESDAPEGLCPRCLIALNLATETNVEEVGPDGTKVVRPSPAAPPAPADIAKYFPQLEILKCMGRGGMGVVYKARQPKLDRFVALKILAPEKESEPKFAERFEREAQALARLSHPNIVAVHDFGETDGLFFLLMEFVDGTNLRQLIQDRKIEPEEALAIVPKICEALQYAHEKGIVHRDIKPENVLIDKEGQVKIADFGIAKLIGVPLSGPTDTLSPSGGEGRVERTSLTEDQVVGTPHYMAPEQVEQPKKVDHRADIYSLGVVFYEMLTGELPLGKFAPPSRKVHVDVRLDEVVLHALEKEPERRYQQASQVKTDVETITADAGKSEVQSKASEPKDAPGPTVTAGASMQRWMLLLGSGWILFAIVLLLGRQMARTQPLMFSFFGVGGWMHPSGYDACISLTVVLGVLCLGLGWVIGRGSTARLTHRFASALLGASPWLLVLIVLLLGKKAVRWEPVMYAFYGVGGWMNPATYNTIMVVCAVLALVTFGVVWFRHARMQPCSREDDGTVAAGRGTQPVAPAMAGGSPPTRGRVWPWVLGCLGGVMLLAVLGVGLLVGMWTLRRVSTTQSVREEARRAELTARMAVTAERERATAEAFSPVMERTITAPESAGTNQPAWWLDLDTGNLVRVPPDLVELDPASLVTDALAGKDPKSIVAAHEGRLIDWMTAQGVDLACGEKRGDLELLTPKDQPLQLVPVDLQLWANGDPAQVLGELATIESGAFEQNAESRLLVAPLIGPPPFPATFAFRTPAGGAGLLQLTDYAAGAAGLQVRFKHINVTPSAASTGVSGGSASIESVRSPAEREKLRLELDSAERTLAMAQTRYKSGRASIDEVNAAQTNVEVLKAKLAGDEVRVAEVQLDAAERALDLAQARFKEGRLPSSELEAARLEVELRKIDVRAAESGTDPAWTTARQFMEALGRGEVPAVSPLLVPDSPAAKPGEEQLKRNVDETRAAYASTPSRLMDFSEAIVENDRAAFRVASPPATPERGLYLVLRRMGSAWRVWDINDASLDTPLGDYLDRALRGVPRATGFGSEVQTTLASQEKGGLGAYLDLDTGRHMNPPSEFGMSWQAWGRQSGVDGTVWLHTVDDQVVDAAFETLDVLATGMPESAWDQMTAADLESKLIAEIRGKRYQIPSIQKLKQKDEQGQQVVWLFKTREGTRGMLQITGLSQTPPGLNLRYKLVEPAETAVASVDVSAESLTARVQLMQAEPGRRYWRWRLDRLPGSRMVYGIIDLTDPGDPKQVLVGKENTPLTVESSEDYVLRLDPQANDWRVEIETAWAGENGGRGSTRQSIDCPPRNTRLRTQVPTGSGELNPERYYTFWQGELTSPSGKLLKRLRFVGRLAAADDPVQNILDKTDPVRAFDEASTPVLVREHQQSDAQVTRKRAFILLPLLLVGLVLVVGIGGGAVWWVVAGAKTGTAMGRAALALAILGLPLAAGMGALLAWVGVAIGTAFYPLFLAFEIPAFALGLMSRQTGLGKAAMITSGTILVISLLFLA